MSSTRKYALWAGVLYLVTFVFSVPTLGMKEPVVDHADFILGAGSEASVLWSGIFDVICGLAGVGCAVALYPVVRRFGRGGAIGYLSSRTIECAMLFVSALTLMSIVTLRQDLAGSADADSLVTAGQSLVAFHDWSFLLGPGIMPAMNAFFLGSVLYRSGLVPRWMPRLGLIGAPMLLAAAFLVAFDIVDQVSVVVMLATLPIAAWELSIGVYMTVKGFRSPDEPAAEVATAPVEPQLAPA